MVHIEFSPVSSIDLLLSVRLWYESDLNHTSIMTGPVGIECVL